MSLRITKADVGKQFYQRGGKIVTITEWDDGHTDLPFRAGGCWYYDNSRVMRYESHPADLIARVPEIADATPAYVNQDGPQNVLRELPTDPAERKNVPIITGCVDYFPLALAEVARISKAGNDQHNPGQP